MKAINKQLLDSLNLEIRLRAAQSSLRKRMITKGFIPGSLVDLAEDIYDLLGEAHKHVETRVNDRTRIALLEEELKKEKAERAIEINSIKEFLNITKEEIRYIKNRCVSKPEDDAMSLNRDTAIHLINQIKLLLAKLPK